ncbi:MAG: hypothetical protein R3Y43_03130 [Alphaproteobacteria bacterium]
MKKIAILCLLSILSACAANIGADDYTTESVGSVNRALRGTVLNVRTVKIADAGTGGSIIGGIAGAAAGTLLGGNDATKIVGGAVGAAAGSWAGSEAQQLASGQLGYEYVIELDNGRIVTLTQGADVKINPGQKCIVLYGDRARVIPYAGGSY